MVSQMLPPFMTLEQTREFIKDVKGIIKHHIPKIKTDDIVRCMKQFVESSQELV